jgi:hypothetical protein
MKSLTLVLLVLLQTAIVMWTWNAWVVIDLRRENAELKAQMKGISKTLEDRARKIVMTHGTVPRRVDTMPVHPNPNLIVVTSDPPSPLLVIERMEFGAAP